MAVKLMMACSTTNTDVYVFAHAFSHSSLSRSCNRNYIPLVNLLGVYFQIRDDLMNLQSTEVMISLHVPSRFIETFSISSPNLKAWLR